VQWPTPEQIAAKRIDMPWPDEAPV
jgi:hypothetical protein